MARPHLSVNKFINGIESTNELASLRKQVAPLSKEEIAQLDNELFEKKPDLEGANKRIHYLKKKGIDLPYVSGKQVVGDLEVLKGNIENYIGMAQVPIGLAGPILVNGINAKGDFFVPLATTEGALVASYSRGMKACRMSGGISSICLSEGVQRSPFFKFSTIFEAGVFARWVNSQMGKFEEIVTQTSRFAQLNELSANVEGNCVVLTFEYSSGDASGQNMVTICTDQICKYILSQSPQQPKEWYIESNYSGDKKATALSFSNVRGKKVSAEVVLSKQVVNEVLKTTPKKVVNYWQASTLAVIQSGAIGAQGHVANALTALFIACGQDVACIAEASVGLTRMEINPNGDLYVAVTLPSLMVGTIGGGTCLPTQNECLQMLECAGQGKTKKFAEICCAVALAGEVSIAAAMSVDHFTNAHQDLGRK